MGEAIFPDKCIGFPCLFFLAAEIEYPVAAIDDFPASADVLDLDGVGIEAYAIFTGHFSLGGMSIDKKVLEAPFGTTDEAGTVHPVVFDDLPSENMVGYRRMNSTALCRWLSVLSWKNEIQKAAGALQRNESNRSYVSGR